MFTALRALILSLLSACVGEELCIAGQQSACECADGEMGARRCSSNNVYAECKCGEESPLLIALPSKRPDRPKKRTVVASIPVNRLAASSSETYDVFVHAAGVILISNKQILMVDRVGQELARADLVYGYLGASLGDDVLAVRNGLNLELRDVRQGLELLAVVELSGPIAGMVMLSSERLVCTLGDKQRTYDGRTGEVLARDGAAIGGRSWRRLPGSDRFVSYEGGQYSLYELGNDNSARLIARSSSSGDYDERFAFDAVPAKHLLSRGDVMISLSPSEDCPWSTDMDQPRCLEQDGALGLGGFSALDASAEHLFAVTTQTISGHAQYVLHTIDVDARAVLTARSLSRTVDNSNNLQLRADPETGRVVVGYFAIDEASGRSQYTVELVAP